MRKNIDRDEIKVILNLYKKDKVTLNQAMNLLGFDGPAYQEPYPGVKWPEIKFSEKKPYFNPKELSDGGC